MRSYSLLGVVAVLSVFAIGLSLTSCGGGGGGGGAAASQVTVIFKDVTFAGTVVKPRAKVLSAPTNTTGEAGSLVESLLGYVSKFELQKNDNSWVTVYSGTGYDIEFIPAPGQTVSDSLVTALPPAGSYKAYRLTVPGIRMKLKLVQGGTTYYTTLQTITSGSSPTWVFSDAASYNYLTYEFYDRDTLVPTPAVIEASFPSPLSVTNSSITLYHVSQRAGTVSCDGNTVNVDITYCSDDNISEGILPAAPTTMAQFVVTATTASTAPPTRTNTITAYFGAQDNFLGATVFRPADWYFNGSTMIYGSGLYSSSTKTGSIDLTIMDGDGIADGTYTLKADLNCATRLYSGLTITATGPRINMESTNYTLSTSGTVTCTAF